jgi:hypothetical protein
MIGHKHEKRYSIYKERIWATTKRNGNEYIRIDQNVMQINEDIKLKIRVVEM